MTLLLNVVINSIYYGVSPLSLPKYHLVEFISFFVILHFAIILVENIEYYRALVVIRNIWVTVVVYSALLGVLFMLDIDIVVRLQELAYNFNFSNTKSLLDTGLDASNYLGRSYSVYAGSNQYSTLASTSLVIFHFLRRQDIISKKLLVILIGFEILILVSSLSRTGFLLYLITVILVLSQNIKYKINYLLFSIIIVTVLNLSLSYFDERIQEIFDLELVLEAFFSERYFHWTIFFNILGSSPESILLGVYEYYLNTRNNFFENGYLNLWAEGGLLSLIGFMLFYYTSLVWFSRIKPIDKALKRAVVNYFLLYMIFEVFMGVFVAFRFESINAITIAFFIYIAYNNDRFKLA
jgi:O-antigen ligase